MPRPSYSAIFDRVQSPYPRSASVAPATAITAAPVPVSLASAGAAQCTDTPEWHCLQTGRWSPRPRPSFAALVALKGGDVEQAWIAFTAQPTEPADSASSVQVRQAYNRTYRALPPALQS